MQATFLSVVRLPLCVAVTVLTMGATNAQYSWAELDMHAPSVEPTNPALRPCTLGVPTTMSASGDVMGTADVRSGTMFDWNSFKVVAAYKRVVLKWPGASSGRIKPTVVATTVMPLYMNNLGSWAGYIPAKTTFPKCQNGFGYLKDTPAVQIGTKVTKLTYGVNGINFEVLGINNKHWVLGSSLDSVGNRKGLVWKSGSFTVLDNGGAQLVFPVAINDNGDVAGYVVPVKDPEQWVEHAALWMGNQLVWRGPPHSRALSVNANGDVLWSRLSDANGWQTFLRAGGIDTPVPMWGKLSTRRTVVGVADTDVSSGTLSVWANGITTPLYDDMRRQGVNLPCDPINEGICESSTLIEQVEPEARQVVVSRTGVSTPSPSDKRYYRIKGLP
jgi:hypothetical protein